MHMNYSQSTTAIIKIYYKNIVYVHASIYTSTVYSGSTEQCIMYIRCQLHTCTLTLGLCSLSFTAACISSGTPSSEIFLMNLLLDRPVVMITMALRLSVVSSLNLSVTSLTLAVATGSFAFVHCPSLKPSWIRREHGRNKSHYHTHAGLLYQCSMSTVLPVEYIMHVHMCMLETIHNPLHTSCMLTGQSTPTDHSYVHTEIMSTNTHKLHHHIRCRAVPMTVDWAIV